MDMKLLKDAVDEISITREQQEEIIDGLKAGRRKSWKENVRRAAVLLLGIGCLSAVIAIPAKAVIKSILEERFGDMTKEEAVRLTEEINQNAEADSYSRDYTEHEKSRMKELAKSYQEGTFPEEEILQTKSLEEAEGEEFYFLISESYFQLPERELTDEELLQIIDYNHKRDYSLAVRYEEEFAEEVEEREKEERDGIKEITEHGGLTQAEAIEIAHGWLVEIYGVTGEGMELNYYLVSEEDMEFLGFSEPVYNVNYSIRSHVYYYFSINAYDGGLEQVSYSSAEIVDTLTEPITVADVEHDMEQLHGKALDFLKNKLKLDHEYVKTTCEYTKRNDVLTGMGVAFCFVKEDGSFDKVNILFHTQDVWQYTDSDDYDDYQESIKENQEAWNEPEGEETAWEDDANATTIGEKPGEHVIVIMDE